MVVRWRLTEAREARGTRERGTDRAGRVIPHEFVLMTSDVTVAAADAELRSLVWDAVADEFANTWDKPVR